MPSHVLNEQDLERFCQDGYVIVPNAAPPENLEAVVRAIWQFLEMDPRMPLPGIRPTARAPSSTCISTRHFGTTASIRASTRRSPIF